MLKKDDMIITHPKFGPGPNKLEVPIMKAHDQKGFA
jgi:hypothetical protein